MPTNSVYLICLQGNDWLSELSTTVDLLPGVHDFLNSLLNSLQEEHGKLSDEERDRHFQYGLDVLSWTRSYNANLAENLPSGGYLRSAPISYPAIGITQLVTLYATYLDMSFSGSIAKWNEFIGRLNGVFGHSQGLVSAVAVGCSQTFEDFSLNAQLAVKLLFWQGLRCEQKSSSWSCMLSVQGLTLKSLMTYLQAFVSRREGKEKKPKSDQSENQYDGISNDDIKQLELLRSRDGDKADSFRKVELEIGLINGFRAFVITGDSSDLSAFKNFLDERRASSDEDQTRTPYSQRKPVFSATMLPISSLFHNTLQNETVDIICGDLDTISGLRTRLSIDKLQLPVYDTHTGNDLRNEELKSLIDHTVRLQAVERLDWISVIGNTVPGKNKRSVILDCGPGSLDGVSSVAKLSSNSLTGHRVEVATCCMRSVSNRKCFVSTLLSDDGDNGISPWGVNPVVSYSDLFRLGENPFVSDWSEDFNVYRQPNSENLATRFSTVIGTRPLIVAGMTPTTSLNGVPLVAASLNAGYEAELACGGLPRRHIFEEKVRDLASRIRPGIGITLNMLYLNAKQWSFQFPSALKMRSEEKLPIKAITVAAGVPSVEKGVEIVQSCIDSGMKFIGFKPGSLDAIYRVLDIAQQVPDVPVVLQWTGGRAGGHHSFEDTHAPLMDSYSDIRKCRNVLLAIGGGLGSGESVDPYLHGTWAQQKLKACSTSEILSVCEKFPIPPMPCDAALLASRMMVAKEAATAPEVKRLIAETEGVTDDFGRDLAFERAEWEKSYDDHAGGVATVKSELGEPIHKIYNRGIKLWKEFDNRFFSIANVSERRKAIESSREEIIKRLNADFQKEFFGIHKSPRGSRTTSFSCDRESNYLDVDEMTYSEVAYRLLEFFFAPPEKLIVYEKELFPNGKWLDVTFKERMYGFLYRAEDTLRGLTLKNANQEKLSSRKVITGIHLLDPVNGHPKRVLEDFFSMYPQGNEEVLTPTDLSMFLRDCKTGGKPVPFIPYINEELSFWFKKDSLWYSEDLSAVRDRDPERVCILQGPVSTRYSTKAEEAAADILSTIECYVARNSTESASLLYQELRSLGNPKLPYLSSNADGVEVDRKILPKWLVVACTRDHTVDPGNGCWMYNPLLSLLRSQRLRSVYCSKDRQLICYDTDLNKVVSVFSEDGLNIHVHLYDRSFDDISLRIELELSEELHYSTLYWDQKKWRNDIKEFYQHVWSSNRPVKTPVRRDFIPGTGSRITEVVKRDALSQLTSEFDYSLDSKCLPLSYLIVPSWSALVGGILSDAIPGIDLLRLVHLHNGFSYISSGAHPQELCFTPADELCIEAGICRISQSDNGVTVSLIGQITNATRDNPRVEIQSEFFIRQPELDSSTFLKCQVLNVDKTFITPPLTEIDISRLQSQSWLRIESELRKGDVIKFDLKLTATKTTQDKIQVRVNGNASNCGIQENTAVGKVTYEAELNTKGTTVENDKVAVVSFLKNFCSKQIDRSVDDNELKNDIHRQWKSSFTLEGDKADATFLQTELDSPYFLLSEPATIRTPKSCEQYASISADWNPIHRETVFANVAQLPDSRPIVHGMWLSAKAQFLVSKSICDGDESRMRAWHTSFQDMVELDSTLYLQAQHVGMAAGDMVLRVTVVDSSGSVKMLAFARVSQQKTAYLFTGQGSAAPGMGMDLYQQSDIAREIWNAADRYLYDKYGFSILQIVRDNPKQLTVRFGGKKGKQIRSNYQKLTVFSEEKQKQVPIIPEITSSTNFYTFRHPKGLLYATQFTQPALVIVQKAAFDTIKRNGFCTSRNYFAGHSLGEYAALSSVAPLLSVETVAELVFRRGIIMQQAVKRDEAGRSDFAMVACNPTRVGRWFTEEALHLVVNLIYSRTSYLIEVVNYNSYMHQYVVAGTIKALYLFTMVLDNLSQNDSPVHQIVDESCHKVEEVESVAKSKGKQLALYRGRATIPLEGIDVPFHSRYLRPGVSAFRQMLIDAISPDQVAFRLPEISQSYIPNLVGKPFEITQEFVNLVYKQTGSPYLKSYVENLHWDFQDSIWLTQLAHTVVIELLAYQFASPVLWIQTQNILFGERGGMKLIEFGSNPVLLGLAKRTMQKLKRSDDTFKLMLFKDSINELHYRVEDRGPSAADYAHKMAEESVEDPPPSSEDKSVNQNSEPSAADRENNEQKSASVELRPAPTPAAKSSLADEQPDALDSIRCIISQKLRKNVTELDTSKSLKDLAEGKSALMNELAGDLATELGTDSLPEGATEESLEAIGSKFGKGKQTLPGKIMSKVMGSTVSKAMPPGMNMNSVRELIEETWDVGKGRTTAIIMYCATSAPSSRFSKKEDVKQWLESVVSLYEKVKNISVPKKGEALSGGTSGADLSQLLKLSQAGHGGSKKPKFIEDRPVQSLSFLKALIGQKLNQRSADIPASSTLQQLSNGKSAVQNEIAGDIEQEFGSKAVPEGAAEIPIGELAKKLQSVYDSRGLGPVSKNMIGRIGSKLPAGYTLAKVRQSLKEEHGLPPGLTESILIHALGDLPSKRFDSEKVLSSWLDATVADYAKVENLDLSSKGDEGNDGRTSDISGLLGQLGSSEPSKEFKEYKTQLNHHLHQQAENIRDFVGNNIGDVASLIAEEANSATELQSFKDNIMEELGDKFTEGISPVFDSRKMRSYSSYWCWSLQELSQLECVIRRAYALAVTSQNWASREQEARAVYKELNFYCSKASIRRISNRPTQQALDFCVRIVEWMSQWNLQDIRCEHSSSKELCNALESSYKSLRCIVKNFESALEYSGFEPRIHTDISSYKPSVEITSTGQVNYSEVPSQSFDSYIGEICSSHKHGKKWIECYHLDEQHVESKPATQEFFNIFEKFSDETSPFSLSGKNILVVGCGTGSIGAEVVSLCLQGGASVYATTSRLSKSSISHFETMYKTYGAKGASLTIFPFNGASKRDVDSLIEYFYTQASNFDFDVVLPFAAINEAGSKLTSLDGKSELAHRLMLTNVLRLMGQMAKKKKQLGFDTQPTQVILPLSPNHGIFGGDGLYAESKLGLESLFNKWHSEDWSDYVTIVGAIIGWTRGTSLMAANNAVAAKLESQYPQIRTFSSAEMAINLLAFMHPKMIEMSYSGPIKADLGGGFEAVPKLQEVVANIRASLQKTSKLTASVENNRLQEQTDVLDGQTHNTRNSKLHKFPTLPTDERRKALCACRGSIDLSQLPVIVGFGELGPWGHAQTRWDVESHGYLSLEGCIEMAWLMGYVEWKDEDGECGWIDCETKEMLEPLSIKEKYENDIITHSGIRILEPELFDGYDPMQKQFMHQIAIERTMDWVEVNSPSDAKEYIAELGSDKVDIMFIPEGGGKSLNHDELIARGNALINKSLEDVPSGSWYIRLKRGGVVSVPRAMRFDRWVVGQIPTGWDPSRFGIPKDLAERIDPVSLYSLVSIAESLVSAGISDPYEFYKYIHVSELGNSAGGGMGGMRALKKIFRLRKEEEDIQNDILQESFINTVPAWINMLLLSSSGPIKTPVGACATAAESIDIAVDTIRCGKAKVMIAGGFDDFGEEGSYEFGAMGATSNADKEASMGRFPSEMSRPTSSSRGGFMEAQGSGIQIVMSADLAIEMGLPIYGVVAHSSTATDKIGRSVPAPGEGILTTARQYYTGKESPLLDLGYRSKQLQNDFSRIEANIAKQDEHLKKDMIHNAQRFWTHNLHVHDDSISPLQSSLSMFGLTVNDITVASFHGTGTKANDLNESEVTDLQMRQLGRTQGNPLYVVCQKYLTGHGKGAAAAWMVNGACQSMVSGLIPGNLNADDVDSQFQRFPHLAYISSSLQLENSSLSCELEQPGVKSVLIKSFGFGQAGGEILLVHPDYLLSNICTERYKEYRAKRNCRDRSASRLGYNINSGKRKLLEVKETPPYTNDQQRNVYLNPRARAKWDIEAKEHRFVTTEELGKIPLTYGRPAIKRSRGDSIERSTQLASFDISAKVTSSTEAIALEQEASKMASQDSQMSNVAGVGVDVEPVSTFSRENSSFESFTQRNFTEKEISLCFNRQDPESSFAGRWAAKEAVIKSISNAASGEYGATPPMWKGGAASLKDIEILADTAGCPVVHLSGYSVEMARMGNVSEVQVSISHSGEYAIAMAYAKFEKTGSA